MPVPKVTAPSSRCIHQGRLKARSGVLTDSQAYEAQQDAMKLECPDGKV